MAKNVASCRNRLYMSLSSARLQQPFNHLVTFPLKFDGLKTKFNELKDLVSNNSVCSKDRNVGAHLFVNPNKLHLTVCTLTLIGDAEIEDAVNLIEGLVI